MASLLTFPMLISTAGKDADVQPFQTHDGQGREARRLRECGAATKALQKLAAPRRKPPRKRPARSSHPRSLAKSVARQGNAVGAPRRGLAETVEWIEAGGMPARPTAARIKSTVPRRFIVQASQLFDEQGKRLYKRYVPLSRMSDRDLRRDPLIVMLHGCRRTPDDFAAGADERPCRVFGLLVAYPAQSVGANSDQCSNWFDRSKSGAPASPR